MTKKSELIELCHKAEELLQTAEWAMHKMGLNGHGSDISLPHEVRMFALAFSDEGRDGPGALQVRGTGEYDAWRKQFRAIAEGRSDSAEMTSAARDVLAERMRQVSSEGWTPEHDDEHNDGSLSAAGSTYALAASDKLNPARRGIEFGGGRRGPSTWPWSRDAWKYGTPRRMLVKAGALILAELERLDRAAARDSGDAK